MPAGPGPAEGHRLGVEVATAVLRLRAGDGAGEHPHHASSSAYGHHRVDPVNPAQRFLGPRWGNAAHVVLPPGPVPPDPPPGSGRTDFLEDAADAADHEEVREVGHRHSLSRPPEQSLIGVFWAYDGVAGIGTPPRLDNRILRRIVTARGCTVEQQVRSTGTRAGSAVPPVDRRTSRPPGRRPVSPAVPWFSRRRRR